MRSHPPVRHPCPSTGGARYTGTRAPVAQRIEHLTTDQKVRGSNPFGRASSERETGPRGDLGAELLSLACHYDPWPTPFPPKKVVGAAAHPLTDLAWPAHWVRPRAVVPGPVEEVRVESLQHVVHLDQQPRKPVDQAVPAESGRQVVVVLGTFTMGSHPRAKILNLFSSATSAPAVGYSSCSSHRLNFAMLRSSLVLTERRFPSSASFSASTSSRRDSVLGLRTRAGSRSAGSADASTHVRQLSLDLGTGPSQRSCTIRCAASGSGV